MRASRAKSRSAGAERLTRAVGADKLASVDPPPRILGPLAAPEAWYIGEAAKLLPLPDVVPDPAEEEAERLVEAVEALGRDEALRALQRERPGPQPDEDRYFGHYVKATRLFPGNLTAARRKFAVLTGLSADRARKEFTAIHRREINTGHN